ncbi:hypothetical protein HHI36_012799 [Cryptolaemus montrouzieri]|uniref:Thioredoxin domain-containing protein n=1 Tax=Cryptolaemus montrouzieri TaxID=559131 RepID=A0ABD2NGQ2_9CUCU
MVKELDDTNIKAFISEGHPALILFYSEWCKYCQIFRPVFKEAAMDNDTPVRFGAYNCSNGSTRAMKDFKVRYFPVIKFFKYGSFIKDYTGQRTVDGIKAFIVHNLDL